MKKWMSKILIGVLPLCLIVSGCGGTPKTETGSIEQSDAFFEQVSIPDGLHLDVDFDRMSTVRSVKQYSGETIDIDQDTVVNAFLKDIDIEKTVYAAGLIYTAGEGDVSEALNIYDGGESFGTPTNVKGGFEYLKEMGSDSIFKWNYVASQDFKSPSDITPDLINSDFASETDLEFEPYVQAVDAIYDIFHAAELPELAIDETFSLDLATMQSHFQLAIEGGAHGGGLDESQASMEWTQDDECYLFSLQQMVDELPIVNRSWQNPGGTKTVLFDSSMPITCLTLTYDHTGIRMLQAQNLIRIVSEEEPVEVISGYDALKVLVEDYDKIIIDRDIHITGAQLCYLLIPDGEDEFSFTLEPGWIFTSSTTDGSGYYTKYRHDMVDAVTGDVFG